MAKDQTKETKEGSALRQADLFGEFRFKVDQKGRLALPAKFRKVLSSDLVVSRELTDECLYVFEPDSFNNWVEMLFESAAGGYNPANRQHVKRRTMLKSRADSVEVDSSGRIMLKPELREAVGITKDVVIVGNTGYFEVWDADAYDKTFEDMDLGVFYEQTDKEDQQGSAEAKSSF